MKPLLQSPEELKQWRGARRDNVTTVVVTNGCFDILHAQHVKHLQEARAYGDVLLVGIDSDERVRKLKGEGRPVNKAEDRAAVLLGLDVVDAVHIFDCESEGFLELARPDVWVKGGDYSIEKLRPQERAVLEQCGGEIVILPLHTGDSTSSIVKRIKLSGTNRVIPIEREPVLHGGPTCDCHKPHPADDPPPVARLATDADREMLGVSTVVSAPTLTEINPFRQDGDPIKEPKTPFDLLYNLVHTTPCPNFGPQMRYPGGLSVVWMPCGTCAVCRLKNQASELRSKMA